MENEKMISEGKCVYCKETFAKAGITKHLAAHLKKIASEKPQSAKAFHVRVEGADYFINLLVNGDAQLVDLDDYIRAIWLECCGHMSSLVEKGKDYDINWDADDSSFGEDMSQPMKDVFRKGQKLVYEYDFGSTTQLEVKVIEEYGIAVNDDIKLLSRNEPLKIVCEVCKTKAAAMICTAHDWNESTLFCKTCAKKHAKECTDFEDMSFKLVNSPRTGVCAYEGGSIDKQRDGVWKEK